jgi:ATP-dependent helicase/nuclease subunit B
LSDYLSDWSGRAGPVRKRAAEGWKAARALLRPLERAFAAERPSLAALIAALREAASALSGDQVWAGPAGRAAAELFAAVEPAAPNGPDRLSPANLAPLLEQLMSAVAVRPPYGQHPRIFIWGCSKRGCSMRT